jgi:hypothetical protein
MLAEGFGDLFLSVPLTTYTFNQIAQVVSESPLAQGTFVTASLVCSFFTWTFRRDFLYNFVNFRELHLTYFLLFHEVFIYLFNISMFNFIY